MTKKRWIRAGILTVIFLVALIISSLITNQGTDDQTIDLGVPTLPRLSFRVTEKSVNALAGHVNEMDITAMRDTITPLEETGTLQMDIEANGNKVDAIQYEVYSLDGKEEYKKGKGKGNLEQSVQLDLSGALPEEVPEAVLKVTLTVEKKDIYFYTRIVRPVDLMISECMQFAQSFHTKSFSKQNTEELVNYLEPNEDGDNTTFQTVTIHSSAAQVTWGNLNPGISGEVEWSIKESNTVYTSLLATYQVTCTGDEGEVETYNIKEFFRVRNNQGEMFLLDYNRSMDQVFNQNKSVIAEDGILLGITSPNVSYETNKKGSIVSFVQQRDLWTYNKAKDQLSLVFSFANNEGRDVRSRYSQHEVRIISMEENGSTAFAVYGYMNRGDHEGEVGVNVYYFDIEKNTVQEKAFIPSNKSFAIAEEELGKMVYYSHERELLFVLAGGKLYQVNLQNNKQEILAEKLSEGQYAVSDDGHLLAYQANGKLEEATEIKVLNLKNGEERTVAAKEGESVRPLGFVTNDFVYGRQQKADKGETVAGEEILPMYGLEIVDSKNKVVKTYAVKGIYISDIFVEKNLVTLNLLTKADGVYSGTDQDYISNNQERKESNVSLESYTTDLKKKQIRLSYAEKETDQSPKILRPKQVQLQEPVTIAFDGKTKTDKFYVYGTGQLLQIYDKATYAIARAELVSGVVISSEQSYIWEKGNRDLVYSTEAQPFQRSEKQTSFEACKEQMKQYEAKQVNLTGCTLGQVLYIVNKGLPVIAMTSPQHAVLITGYTTENVTYVEPDNGQLLTVSIDEMAAMAEGSGNTFIGYVN